MISSVIARLDCDAETRKRAMTAISSHPDLEIGELVDSRLLPVTIESNGNLESEEMTRWLLTIDGVAFVDVVFVHFEESDLTKSNDRQSAIVSTSAESMMVEQDKMKQ